jgi:hypothetical protein
MKRLLFTALISLILSSAVFAQIIDDSDLRKLESGKYKLEQGMIQVSFTDTVSADYMEQQLSKYGYEILSSNFKNILLTIQGEPIHEQLNELKANKWVEFLISSTTNITEEELKVISKMNSMDEEKADQLLSGLDKSRGSYPVFISLIQSATSSEANNLISSYPDLDLRIIRESQRSAVIKTEPGKEAEVMEALGQMSFVKSTALIGVIK